MPELVNWPRTIREGSVPELKRENIQRYLESALGGSVTVLAMAILGKAHTNGGVKGYGYGIPLRVDFRVSGGECRTAVLHTMSPGAFGHEHMADRAHELLWEHQAFNRLPRHVRSLDVCGFEPGGQLRSMSDL